MPPPAATDTTSGIRKFVGTPPISTPAADSRGNPRADRADVGARAADVDRRARRRSPVSAAAPRRRVRRARADREDRQPPARPLDAHHRAVVLRQERGARPRPCTASAPRRDPSITRSIDRRRAPRSRSPRSRARGGRARRRPCPSETGTSPVTSASDRAASRSCEGSCSENVPGDRDGVDGPHRPRSSRGRRISSWSSGCVAAVDLDAAARRSRPAAIGVDAGRPASPANGGTDAGAGRARADHRDPPEVAPPQDRVQRVRSCRARPARRPSVGGTDRGERALDALGGVVASSGVFTRAQHACRRRRPARRRCSCRRRRCPTRRRRSRPRAAPRRARTARG